MPGVDGNQADNSASSAGAAYVFNGFGPAPETDVSRGATTLADGSTDDLGYHAVGAAELSDTIDNSAGSAELTIPTGGVTGSGLTNCSGFTVDTTLPLSVTAGSSETLTVSFTIDAEGSFSLDLDIANNDTDENPYDIAVEGTSIPPNTPPTITGTVAGQQVNDNGTVNPFAAVTIDDADNDPLNVSVTLSEAVNGALAGGGFIDEGGGVYTLSNVLPAGATTAIRELVFTPTENQVAVGSTVTTGFTIAVEEVVTP